MEYYFDFILFTQLVMVGLFFIFKNTAPSYLKKKAEDLATLEDIGKITKEVKSVEHEFSEKLSIFQADLNILKSHSQKLGDEERELLIRLYQACNKVVFSIKQIKFKLSTEYQLTEIENEIVKWTGHIELLIEIRSDCELFITNSELKGNAISFVNHSLNFTDEIKLVFSYCCRSLVKIQGFKDTIKAVNRSVEKAVGKGSEKLLTADPSNFEKNDNENRIHLRIHNEYNILDKVLEVNNEKINAFLPENHKLKENFINSFRDFYKLSETEVYG